MERNKAEDTEQERMERILEMIKRMNQLCFGLARTKVEKR